MMKPEPSEVPRRFCCSPPLLVEELLEQLLERRAGRQLRHVAQARTLLRHVLGGGDVDHGRQQFVDQIGEAVAARRAPRAGCASTVPNATTAATAAALENAMKTQRESRPTSNGAQGQNGSERPAPRVRVPVYMAAECGANKEAVMLLYISAFSGLSPKIIRRRGRSATARRIEPSGARFLAATSWRPARGVVEVAEEVGVGAQDHGRPPAPKACL